MNKTKVLKNASWILGLQILKALINFVISLISARYLGDSNFGLINYAASVVAFVVPILHLGFNCTLVAEFINHPDKEGETLGTAVTLSFLASFLCIGGSMAFVAVANQGEPETIIVCALYSTLLVFQSMELIGYWFEAKLISKYSSLATLIAYMVMSAYKIFLLATEKGVKWFAVSNAVDYIIIAVVLLILYKKKGTQKLKFSVTRAKEMFARSKYYIISELMITVFAVTDKIMLKHMMGTAATGNYSVAVLCAGMTGFVFSAIIDSFRPMIFDSKKNTPEEYEKNLASLFSVVIYLALLQSVVMSVFAGFIVNLLYGAEYVAAIEPLRIVVWYTTFSYIGSVRNIWILSEGKQQYVWKINLAGALANVLLNACLIPFLGMAGAAVASLVTQIFTNVIMGYILKPIRHANSIMLEGLKPKYVIEVIKFVLKGHKNESTDS